MPMPGPKPAPVMVSFVAAPAAGAAAGTGGGGGGEVAQGWPRTTLAGPSCGARLHAMAQGNRRASDVFVECLEAEGVKYVFGIPGEETLDLNQSLANSPVSF